MTTSREGYRKGDHWLIDARTGSRIRKSESRKEYTGAIVHKDDWEPRHPQEFVRGKRDKQAVTDPRPEPVDTFMGPLSTLIAADALAGETTIVVESSVRFTIGDAVRIALSNSNVFRANVQSVPDAATMTIYPPLPWATEIGMAVVNESAVSAADIG